MRKFVTFFTIIFHIFCLGKMVEGDHVASVFYEKILLIEFCRIVYNFFQKSVDKPELMCYNIKAVERE